ncbi:unnamed protein product [Polarella glacialis]|uniref:Choline transporter-like protein n=1 Tax=Polarella glacialis TaxID=89957 RepID=A0A813HBC3_POLGL|nr:unnamed protein product [Polarella glacialis]
MGQPVAAGPYQPGRSCRVKPCDASLASLPLLQGIPVGTADRKVHEIHRGGELATDFPAFPASRAYRDAFWIIPILLVVLAVICLAADFSRYLSNEYNRRGGDLPSMGAIIGPGIAGRTASLLAAQLYAALAKSAPGCIGSGLVHRIFGWPGLVHHVRHCLRGRLPEVLEDQLTEDSNRGTQQLLYVLAVLIFIWGAQVALTTSFGSICFGALLVAAMRAWEAFLCQARKQAQQEGNTACCLLLMAVECVVSCIGDILEYFSEWAYVQCAVRGVSFVEAARITYSP